ncbi:NUDIX domain-containing protein [Devriesea agamarum]|uniref:NUDIX domain-containing protein n=1 Tax=Devriesea agamarum TaxID=472569 RepID=UPI00071DCA0A|nr:NUDIX domain-containing protein [Devriesea agamarum]
MNNPTIRVRAAGILATNNGILVQRKVNDHHWALPGGQVEFGEYAKDALWREFNEELGIDIEVGEQLTVLENFFELNSAPFHSIEFYFRIGAPQIGSAPPASTEPDLEFQWWIPGCDREFRPHILEPLIVAELQRLS